MGGLWVAGWYNVSQAKNLDSGQTAWMRALMGYIG